VKFKQSQFARTSHNRRLNNGARINAVIIHFSKAFDLVPPDRLLPKIEASREVTRVVVWIREFRFSRTQRVRVGGQLSEEVRVKSGVPQGSVLGPLLWTQLIFGEILSQRLHFSQMYNI
jgi:hypothetical protein